MVGTTWKSMGPQDKAPYERVASEELGRYMDAKRTFEALHRHYSTLHYGAQEAGACMLPPLLLQPLLLHLVLLLVDNEEQGKGDMRDLKMPRCEARGSMAGSRCGCHKRSCATEQSSPSVQGTWTSMARRVTTRPAPTARQPMC